MLSDEFYAKLAAVAHAATLEDENTISWRFYGVLGPNYFQVRYSPRLDRIRWTMERLGDYGSLQESSADWTFRQVVKKSKQQNEVCREPDEHTKWTTDPRHFGDVSEFTAFVFDWRKRRRNEKGISEPLRIEYFASEDDGDTSREMPKVKRVYIADTG